MIPVWLVVILLWWAFAMGCVATHAALCRPPRAKRVAKMEAALTDPPSPLPRSQHWRVVGKEGA